MFTAKSCHLCWKNPFDHKGHRGLPLVIETGLKSSVQALLVAFCWSFWTHAAWADVIPDTSLPEPTVVTSTSVGHFNIQGGTLAGPNLLHSFESFSIPEGGEAHFDTLDTSIEHIISRVTGDSASTIEGLIKANGSADLFLINPNGIIFGPDAKLEIGGSFIGSTAKSLEFADGASFSATDPASDALLTVSTPVGLQVAQGAAPITVQDEGNTVVLGPRPLSVGSPSQRNTTEGLQVSQGESLILIGGDVAVEGGILFSPAGRVEIAGIGQGKVTLAADQAGWQIGYGQISEFKDISLSDAALLDASDEFSGGHAPAGSIHLQAEDVTVEEGSLLFMQYSGVGSDGIVSIEASGLVTFLGPNQVLGGTGSTVVADEAGILLENLGVEDGGLVKLSATDFKFVGGAGIDTSSFGKGDSADIDVSATHSILFRGEEVGTGISTRADGAGDAGDITIDTATLDLEDGGVISSQTLSGAEGNSGSIEIKARDEVNIGGVADTAGLQSLITTTSFGDGAAGEVELTTRRLTLERGGWIVTDIYGRGSSGDIEVYASESVVVTGESEIPTLSGMIQPSQISASASDFDTPTEQFLGLPAAVPEGTTGGVEIETPSLTISEGATINSFHVGSCEGCNGGSIEITANTIFLDEQGNITTFSASGQGGDIDLDVADELTLRRGAQIEATAAGSSPESDGGNISATADLILAIPEEDSDIEAAALAGEGGNIEITANGLLGFQISDGETPLSDLNASSSLGVDGVVEITDPDADLDEDFLLTDEAPVDPAALVALGCSPAASSFLITGRGGLPVNPLASDLSSLSLWQDLRPLESGAEVETVGEAEPEEEIRLTGLALDPENQLLVMAEDAAGSALGCRFMKMSQVN